VITRFSASADSLNKHVGDPEYLSYFDYDGTATPMASDVAALRTGRGWHLVPECSTPSVRRRVESSMTHRLNIVAVRHRRLDALTC
jgi:hypothetical protein